MNLIEFIGFIISMVAMVWLSTRKQIAKRTLEKNQQPPDRSLEQTLRAMHLQVVHDDEDEEEEEEIAPPPPRPARVLPSAAPIIRQTPTYDPYKIVKDQSVAFGREEIEKLDSLSHGVMMAMILGAPEHWNLMTVFEDYHRVVKELRGHAAHCGRNPDDIMIVAVTKHHDLSYVLPAYQAGCRHFGENRVQEALAKMEDAPQDLHWHLIGNLQKNKVRKVIGRFYLIHSVDSVELAKKIGECSNEAGVQTSILLEVNTSGEQSKQGFSVGEFPAAFQEIAAITGLSVKGLMTMAPHTGDEDVVRAAFRELRQLRDRFSLEHLSMGMSGDYRIAIEEGATIVRLGTRIFGERSLVL